jgi:hypothetical protein
VVVGHRDEVAREVQGGWTRKLSRSPKLKLT